MDEYKQYGNSLTDRLLMLADKLEAQSKIHWRSNIRAAAYLNRASWARNLASRRDYRFCKYLERHFLSKNIRIID